HAETKPPVVVWPTLTPAGDTAARTALHKPQPQADSGSFARAQELDATLRDAVQDLGFTLYLADAGPAPSHARDADLIERAARSAEAGTSEAGTWVISPRVEPAGGGNYVVRIVAVPPKGQELRVRVETVRGDSVSVRGLVMLRELLSPRVAAQAELEQEREQTARGSAEGIMGPPRSGGRAVLAVNAGLFGAFAAFSAQRASGSDDPRVLYPLLALGTGMGVGGALLVADEWDVSPGDAWFLSAGAWWGATSAFLIGAGQDVQPLDDRYAWGVGGGLLGVGLAAFALTQTPMDEGDATLVHSGGVLGLLAGGATDLLYRGESTKDVTPYAGMGYGTVAGLLAAGALATQITISPSRVLLIDLGVGGGALVGAAAASPLIFQSETPAGDRGWFSATLGGAVAGGLAAWWLTRSSSSAKSASWLPGAPSAGVIGGSATRWGTTPIYGVAWAGGF
ncbi:MAG: hypothetical protein ACREJ3_07540, partial [Polyangiaceae bacterium]